MSAEFDSRLTPARPDLAAMHLRGRLDAARFVEGRPWRVVVGTAGLHRAPRADAPMDTQLLFGEDFTVYEERDGWAWGQSHLDGYVGYVAAAALGGPIRPTHRVCVPMTFLYSAPDIKVPPTESLPMNARLAVAGQDGRFARLATGGFVWREHLLPAGSGAADFVAIAEQFVHAPYLWGGRTAAGIDCSGLVQTALVQAGIAAPRDTDLQEAALGVALPDPADTASLRRGDLLFWKGHVGIVADREQLLHANAHHMQVAIEPLAQALVRIQRAGASLRCVRRLAAPDP